MAFMDRFKRKQTSVLPAEVQQYYQAEQRQRTGVAVLLGIVALVVTMLVASALFYGGRYAYRQINKDDKKTAVQPAAQETATDKSVIAPEGSSQATDTQAPSTPAITTPAPASSPNLGDTPADTTPAPAPASLPRTGDEGL